MNLNSGVEIDFLLPKDSRLLEVGNLASSVLDQDRYLWQDHPHSLESHIVAAFVHGRAVGFLRFLVQVVGSEEGRTPIEQNGAEIIEAYVEAFGVDPGFRRRGIGLALQKRAIDYARDADCYQIRSQSPVTSRENYALKLAAGYAIHPSPNIDSYYFILKI